MAGAASGFVAVAIGAFAAHAISDPQAKAWIETGAKYHLAHTMTIFVSLSFRNWGATLARHASGLFFFGCVLFAGSLYAMALGGPRWLGAITPIGGILFLLGWAVLIAAALQLMRQEGPPRDGPPDQATNRGKDAGHD
jgi:uncharacterized membrane protein YgdD (TMEM256/DUF423 family)